MNSKNLNDLFDYGYKIYQNDEYFKFSIDSVLLAEFVKFRKGKNTILDLCSGNAPIPMILSKKFGDKIDIYAVELQKEIYELGKDSIEYNKINNITYINDDVYNLKNIFPNKKFSVITCNPPYFMVDGETCINDNKIKATARHELSINLEDIVKLSSKMIENQGYFYLVHRPERIVDLITMLKKYKFGVKRIQTVFNDSNSRSCLVLIESIFNGKDYVMIDKPLFLKDFNSYKDIFGK